MAVRSFWGAFMAFRSILQDCLLEEICFESKIALKNVFKIVSGVILADYKNFLKSICGQFLMHILMEIRNLYSKLFYHV